MLVVRAEMSGNGLAVSGVRLEVSNVLDPDP
jgi:hypothetical protein